MRASGLAHILSISGLHMAIVGGFVFAAFRLGVAAWPWLALRIDGKKLAALAGLGSVGAYLVLSGAPPPAERAAITASVAFLAILVERRAISLHALALAALIILLPATRGGRDARLPDVVRRHRRSRRPGGGLADRSAREISVPVAHQARSRASAAG
jgi:hypothetical protein